MGEVFRGLLQKAGACIGAGGEQGLDFVAQGWIEAAGVVEKCRALPGRQFDRFSPTPREFAASAQESCARLVHLRLAHLMMQPKPRCGPVSFYRRGRKVHGLSSLVPETRVMHCGADCRKPDRRQPIENRIRRKRERLTPIETAAPASLGLPSFASGQPDRNLTFVGTEPAGKFA